MDPEDARHHPSQSIPNAAYPDARGYQPGTGGGSSPSENNGSNTTYAQGQPYPSTAYSTTTSADPSTRPWSPSPSQLHDPPPPYNPSDTDNRTFANSSGYAAGSSRGDESTYGARSGSGAMSNIPLQDMPPVHNYQPQSQHEQERAALYPQQRPLQPYPGHSLAKPGDAEAQGQVPGGQDAMMRTRKRRRRRFVLLGGGLFAIFLLALLIGIGLGVIRKIRNGDDDDDDDDDHHRPPFGHHDDD